MINIHRKTFDQSSAVRALVREPHIPAGHVPWRTRQYKDIRYNDRGEGFGKTGYKGSKVTRTVYPVGQKQHKTLVKECLPCHSQY